MTNKRYFDMHCDTLTRRYQKGVEMDSLDLEENVIALSKVPEDQRYGQFFAIFVPDSLRGQDAVDFFLENAHQFHRQCQKFSGRLAACRSYHDAVAAWEDNKVAGILTIEGGAAFGGDLDNVALARDLGVRACTLTWNGVNELASGSVDPEMHLTDFGRDCIREMESSNIIVDVSHLNDPGFYDVLRVAKRPFIATHSNARAVANHSRNLTDDMIREMIQMGGLIGLNFYIQFLNEDGAKATMDDLFRHAEHILELEFSVKFIFSNRVPSKYWLNGTTSL